MTVKELCLMFVCRNDSTGDIHVRQDRQFENMASVSTNKIPLRPTAVGLLISLLLASLPLELLASSNEQHISKQMWKISQATLKCNAIIANATKPDDGELYCEPIWDNLMCWPDYVRAGDNATQPCPAYIDGFNINENAVRSCTKNGTWRKHPKYNRTWTDFQRCMVARKHVPAIIHDNIPIVTQIATIGYSISLGTLIVATAIMVAFKRLHCQRNTIHVNLFMSFMLRAVICLLRNTLLVKHFALPGDIIYAKDGTLLFIQEGTHWECKLLNTLWQYSLSANYMWIFVEGLYLHTLIFFAVFSQSKKFFKLYIVIGWVLPLTFIIIWIFARIFKNNTLCWNTHTMGFYWILRGPIVTSISVNFFFFLNIIRVLFTKIRDCNTRDPRRYRKLAKSTLVLIPLFGVYYIFFIVLNAYQDPKVAIVYIYLEMTLNSFQGTVIAFLFCFLNGEVRGEIMKRWRRRQLRRHSVVSGRSSRALSTTSYCTGRDRASLPLGVPLGEVVNVEGRVSGSTTSPFNNNNNGRIFRKVSSMPKISSDSYTSPTKPITRAGSSSKVTFSVDDTCVDQNTDCINISPKDSPAQANKHNVSNGVREMSKTDETKTLLTDIHTKTNNVIIQGKDRPKSRFRLINFVRGIKVFRSKEVGVGVVDQHRSVPTQTQCVNALPPLSDVEEDVSDTFAR